MEFLLLCLLQCLIACPLVLGFFFPGCCFCSTGCGIFSSTFDSLDGFNVVSGTWNASGNLLRTSSDDAVISCSLTHPDGGDGNRSVQISMSAPSGSKIYYAFDYVSPSSFLAVEADYTGVGHITIVSVSGGVATPIDEPVQWPEPGTFTLHYRPNGGTNNVRVTTSAKTQFFRTVSPLHSDRVALATGTLTGEATFGSFVYAKHYGEASGSCVTAPNCVISQDFGDHWHSSTDWTFDAGTNTATPPASGAAGVALADFVIPENEYGYYVGASAYSSINQGIIFDAIDEDNFHALVKQQIGTARYVKLIKRQGGVDTDVCTLFDDTSNSFANFLIFVSSDNYVAVVDSRGTDPSFMYSTVSWNVQYNKTFTPLGGRKAGLIALAEHNSIPMTLFRYSMLGVCGVAQPTDRTCGLYDRQPGYFGNEGLTTGAYRHRTPNGWLVEVANLLDGTRSDGTSVPAGYCSAWQGTWQCLPKIGGFQVWNASDWSPNAAPNGGDTIHVRFYREFSFFGDNTPADGKLYLGVTLYFTFDAATGKENYAFYAAEVPDTCDVRSVSGLQLPLRYAVGSLCQFAGATVTISATDC